MSIFEVLILLQDCVCSIDPFTDLMVTEYAGQVRSAPSLALHALAYDRSEATLLYSLELCSLLAFFAHVLALLVQVKLLA